MHPAIVCRHPMCRHPMRRWSIHHRRRQECLRLRWGQWQVFQQLLLLPRLQGMSRSLLWCFWWLMNQAHSAVLQFRLLDTCRATILPRVTCRSLGWGACTTPAAITTQVSAQSIITTCSQAGTITKSNFMSRLQTTKP